MQNLFSTRVIKNLSTAKHLKYWKIFLFILFFSPLWVAVDSQLSFAVKLEQKVHLLLVNAENYSKKGNHEFALKMCKEAIRLQPQNLDAYYRRGFVLGRAGAFVPAIRDFTLVLKQDEKNERLRFPAVRKFRADCFVAIGHLQNAIDDYSVMLKRDARSDGSGKIWFYLAETFALMNRTGSALNAIKNGCATGSHWCDKMKILQKKILTGERIVPHKPFSN